MMMLWLALLLSVKIVMLYGFYILQGALYHYTIHKHRREIDMRALRNISKKAYESTIQVSSVV